MSLFSEQSHIIRIQVEGMLKTVSTAMTGNSIISQICQKTGLNSLLAKRFGQAEILDDIVDHWDAESHLKERDHMLQSFLVSRGAE